MARQTGPRPSSTSSDFLIGNGDMARLIRAKDWANTPLGPINEWPQSLRTTVSLCLASNFPINIIWGPEHTQIYNDGYRIVCGEAHPQALGEAYTKTWASAWPAIGNPFARALAGETSFLENQRMFLFRNGYLEETFFTFSISPIRDETGGIGGLFHPVTETTASMLAERRTRVLRDLNAEIADARSTQSVYTLALRILADYDLDLPFVACYRQTGPGVYGLVGDHACSDGSMIPPILESGVESVWPVAKILRSRGPLFVEGLRPHLGEQGCGPYEEGPDAAVALPIHLAGADEPSAIVLAGISPRLPVDQAHRDFYSLLRSALAAGFANARAYEEERERAEALAELDRAKIAFFSNVSHEFRTPLTLLLGPLEEALADDNKPVDRANIAIAHRNALRLLKLVNSLLEFSRLEAGRLQASFEPTDLSALTVELASNFSSAFDRAGLSLAVRCQPLPDAVFVDRDLWEKIVLNLLSNAFKFTLAGGVTLTLGAEGEHAVLTVADTGVGIPETELPRIFERFHRVEGQAGRTFEGTGIGLALVEEVVRLHGGTIAVTSVMGSGTTFRVALPRGSAHLPAERVQASRGLASTAVRSQAYVAEALRWVPEPSTVSDDDIGAGVGPIDGRPFILLADDNADMRGYVTRVLTEGGYEVDAVNDGEAALRAIRNRRPDLILSDVMMPKLDGFGLLSAVRADRDLEGLQVILLSARAGEEARVEGLEAGADDYMVKPFSARELRARLDAAVTLGRQRRASAERERELLQQILDRSLERGQTWQVSPDLQGILNTESQFEQVNPAWTDILGWTPEEVSAFSIFELIHPDDLERTRAAFQDLLDQKPVLRFENRYRTKAGAYRWLSWVAVPESGKFYCSARDVTDEKAQAEELVATQEALRQAQKMEAIGQLTGGIAHDFNNMLTGISGSLELLESRLLQGRLVGLERYIDAAQTGARRAAALTQRLLAFSRRQTLDAKPIEVNKLIGGMEDLIRRSVGPTVIVEVIGAGGLWPTKVDPSQLENSLLNLCINARDAMVPDGGRLTIETANKWLDERAAQERDLPPGQYVSLCVTDTGSGMTPETVARAFDPFFTTKPIGEGTGLGLSMIYGFVRQSGGQVRIYSEVGEGTTMCLYLPRYLGDLDAAEFLPTASKPPLGDGETVLVIDDEPTIRMLIVEVLEENGYSSLEAADGASGLRILQAEGRIDLLITDVGLPGGLNGRQVADAARQTRPDLRVLFITGYAENAVMNNGYIGRGMEVITKPFVMSALATKIREMIER